MNQIKNKINNREAGFVRLILVIIIILVAAKFFGFRPEVIWNDVIMPVIEFGWKIIKWIADVLYSLIKIIVDLFHVVIGLFNRAA